MIKRYNQFILENINSESKIENIKETDIPEILEMCAQAFGEVEGSQEEVKEYLKGDVNFRISKKSIIDGKIVGCYLFNEESVYDFLKNCDCLKEDISKYKKLRGIQGCALVVIPEYKGEGIGRKLREIPLKMGYDYVWGQHLKGLHNIDNWTKFGRRLVADGVINGSDMWVTLMDLKKKPQIT